MKKITIFAVLVILLAALVSCDKDPIPSAPPVTYTISTTVIGKGSVAPDKLPSVNLGSSVNFKFTPDEGYSVYSVKVNGIKVEDIQPASSEVSYIIRDINKNLNVEVTFVETDILIFSAKSTSENPWTWTKLDIYRASDDLFLRSSLLSQKDKTDKYYNIYPSMEVIVQEADGGTRKGTWSLKQRVLQLDSQVVELLELTPTKFVYKAKPIWGSGDNCYVYAQLTFERK